jgi:multidrug efflux system membrane fusion protein
MFVRVRLPIGQPHDALLVIDRAIGSDQGMKYVYLVDDKNIVQQQRVETGALEEDGLRVIDSGLKAGEWVVIGGIQQVRPRMQITPDREPMPTLGLSSEGMTSASGKPAEGKSDAGKSNAAKSRDAKSGAKQSTDSKSSPSPGAKASPGPAKSD